MSTVEVDDVDPPAIDDEALEALALAADPDAPIPEDARPLDEVLGVDDPVLVPTWYMPASRGRLVRRGWRRRVIWTVVVAFLAIDAYGLCSTYGTVDLAGVQRTLE